MNRQDDDFAAPTIAVSVQFEPAIRSNAMNKNSVEGNVKQVKGSVKEALGKVIGNEGLETEGATEKVEGKGQENLGKVQKAAADAAKKSGN
jgi:uncharacterized protein YjbJ (UPF0337 family)